ncbi:MAG: FecR family protein, partial [Patescibacteria group bacterium]
MKKVVFIGGIVLLLSVVIVMVLISQTRTKKTLVNLPEKKEVTPFVLTLKSGVVEYRKSTIDAYVVLATGSAALPSKSMVKTGIGTAEVLLENGSQISIDENTEITLNADSMGIKIQQFLGNTWHRVQKLLGVQTYQVITPTAVATVRGTKFGVRTLLGISKIITTENTVGVQLRTINPEGKEELGKEEPVSAGNESEILEAEKEIIIQKISPAEREDKWFKKNEEFDREYDKKVDEIKKEFEDIKKEEEKKEREEYSNIERNPTPVSRLPSPDRGGEREEDMEGERITPPPARPPLDEIRENPTQPSPNRGGEREERLPPPPPPPPTRPPLEGVSKESE